MSFYRIPSRGAFNLLTLRCNRHATIFGVSITPSVLNTALMTLQRFSTLLPSNSLLGGVHFNDLDKGNRDKLMGDKRMRNEGTQEFSYRLIGHSARSFSTTAKPFSRKRPPRKPTEADIDATNNAIDASEPLLSFNYQATLGIIQIARAVAPIVSMNEGYILTANYDLRTDGERKILGLQMFQSLLS